MKAYRLYVLNPHEHVFEALEGQYADDFAALEDAEAMRADRFAVEVWNGERLVGRVGGEFSL